MRFGVLVLGLALVALSPLAAADQLSFGEMYIQSVLGTKFTPKLTSLAGKTIEIVGSMAPPLRADGDFFVLTKNPVSLCPFCQSDADWPADILVVYLKDGTTFSQHNRPLVVTGRLELGSKTDPVTGFVSLVRLVDAEYRDR